MNHDPTGQWQKGQGEFWGQSGQLIENIYLSICCDMTENELPPKIFVVVVPVLLKHLCLQLYSLEVLQHGADNHPGARI